MHLGLAHRHLTLDSKLNDENFLNDDDDDDDDDVDQPEDVLRLGRVATIMLVDKFCS